MGDAAALWTEGSRFLLAEVAGAGKPEWLVVPAPAHVARHLEALAARPEGERAALDAEIGASLSTPGASSMLGAAGGVSPLP